MIEPKNAKMTLGDLRPMRMLSWNGSSMALVSTMTNKDK